MATDATGTPTPKGIPKYNTSVDAPSGLGFNAAMDAIDGLLSWVKARKNSAGSVFERSRFNFIEGSNITITVADDATDNEIDITIASTSATVGYGTSLPVSPTDGQEYILVDSTTAPTYQWRFRFNNSATTNKWEFIGGAPKDVFVDTDQSTTTTATWLDLTTVGPSFTVPVAGNYEVLYTADGYHSAAGAQLFIGPAVGAGTPGVNKAIAFVNAGQTIGFGTGITTFTGLAASAEIRLRYYMATAGTGNWTFRRIRVIPLRVGG